MALVEVASFAMVIAREMVDRGGGVAGVAAGSFEISGTAIQ
jgi:hypothetical protein